MIHSRVVAFVDKLFVILLAAKSNHPSLGFRV